MKYHYQIVKIGTDEVVEDSRNIPILKDGTDRYQKAVDMGNIQIEYLSYDNCITRVIPEAETVTEEDELAGHPYPGHECWDNNWTGAADVHEID